MLRIELDLEKTKYLFVRRPNVNYFYIGLAPLQLHPPQQKLNFLLTLSSMNARSLVETFHFYVLNQGMVDKEKKQE